MKKGVLALLIVLALVVLISPGIVGRMAEKSVDDQLQWAADENKEIKITTESFDRGWFSSEGKHRIELGDTGAGLAIREQLEIAPGGPSPAFVVSTKIDHGLIPVSSVTRQEGSLTPGLGRAVSTVSFEGADGSVTEIPGVIYSELGLDGALTSHYFVDAGNNDTASWGAGDLKVEANANAGTIAVDGGIDSMSFDTQEGEFQIGKIDVSSDMEMTDYGYTVGDMSMSIASVDVSSPMSSVEMGPIEVAGESALDGDRVDSQVTMDFAMAGLPAVGDVSWTLDASLDGVQAEHFGKVIEAVETFQGDEDPQLMLMQMQNDLADLVAAGLELRFDKFDIALPQGVVATKMSFNIPETDRSDFAWTGVLLALDADADISIPVELYEMAAAMNPQASAAVTMGFLIRNGDNYEMQAEYKKGRLTVNGEPMSIPMPGM